MRGNGRGISVRKRFFANLSKRYRDSHKRGSGRTRTHGERGQEERKTEKVRKEGEARLVDANGKKGDPPGAEVLD